MRHYSLFQYLDCLTLKMINSSSKCKPFMRVEMIDCNVTWCAYHHCAFHICAYHHCSSPHCSYHLCKHHLCALHVRAPPVDPKQKGMQVQHPELLPVVMYRILCLLGRDCILGTRTYVQLLATAIIEAYA